MIKVRKWTGKEKVVVKDVIKVLNQALKIDPFAIRRLFKKRSLCRQMLANHKSIQVHETRKRGGELYNTLGFLGLLNGLIGIDKNSYGPITAVLEGKRPVLTKFVLTKTK